MDKLDTDLLRTFLAVADTGSLTDGAARIFRSQSAASLQIKRLESILGKRVFDRHGRGVNLTDMGERLLPVAREVTFRLDSTFRQLTSDQLDGRLRIGVPDDHSQLILAKIISEFVQSHPQVELDVKCELSTRFPKALKNGDLDIAVYEVQTPQVTSDVLLVDQTSWVMSRNHDLLANDVLPVALFDRECWWRDVALSALEDMRRPYKVIYSSQSVNGVSAAIQAGVAIGLLGQISLPSTLKPLGPKQGFPAMPCSQLVLGVSNTANTPVRTSMENAIRRAFSTP